MGISSLFSGDSDREPEEGSRQRWRPLRWAALLAAPLAAGYAYYRLASGEPAAAAIDDGDDAAAARDPALDEARALYGLGGKASVTYAVGAGGRILSSINGGRTWHRHPSGTTRALGGVWADERDGTRCATGEGGTILHSTDGGL